MPEERPPARYGYYSQKSVDEGNGVITYKKKDGKEVQVTAVYSSLEEARAYKWPDKKFVAVVYECVS